MSLVDGFDLKYLSRTQSAERRLHGQLIDTIPVAWVASWRSAPVPDDAMAAGKAARKTAREVFIEISFPDAAAMAAQKAKPAPFVVALAEARSEGKRGSLADFRGVFEVSPTGVDPSPTTLETRVLRRVTASEA